MFFCCNDAFDMPGGAKKFRSVHRFGKKRAKNNKRANGTTSRACERGEQATLDLADAPAPDNGGGGGAGIGNPPVPREDDCADSGRLRIDSGVVTSSDIAQERAREIATLDRLDSTPATSRKTTVFADENSATFCFGSMSIGTITERTTL